MKKIKINKDNILMKYSKVLTLFFIVFFLTHKIYSQSDMPNWVLNRPIDNMFYIGIGFVDINDSDDYIEVAKNNALKDLASEISVNIKGISVFQQMEKDGVYNDKFHTQTQVSFVNNLEQYEIVDSWSDSKKYWVFYRLSKSIYKSIIKEKIEKSKSKSLDLLTKANRFHDYDDYSNALHFYCKAFEEIEPYLHYTLLMNYENKKINLGNEIYKSIFKLLSSITIKFKENNIETRYIKPKEKEKIIYVTYSNKSKTSLVFNLPLKVFFSKPKSQTSVIYKTDRKGQVIYKISNINLKLKEQELTVTINLVDFLNSKSILYSIIKSKNILPEDKLYINNKPTIAFFKFINNSMNLEHETFSENIKSLVVTNLFDLTNKIEEAEYGIIAKVSLEKGRIIDNGTLRLVEKTVNLNIRIIEKETRLLVFQDKIKIKNFFNIEDDDATILNKIENKLLKKIEKSFKKFKK